MNLKTENMKNKSIRVISAVLSAAMILLILPFCISAEEEADEPLATLMLTSDYQDFGSLGYTKPIDNLTAICAAVSTAGITPDSFVLCGDLTNESGLSNYNGPENVTRLSYSRSKKVVNSAFGESIEYHALQGNHDPFLPDIMDATGAYEYDNYILYVINTEDGNPWGQGAVGAEETLKETAKVLYEYMKEKIQSRETRPVIVATHVPLHFGCRTSSQYGTGDNMYSRYLFNVLNSAGKYLNIVYLFGHNHSKGFDNYLGGGSIYRPCGTTVLIPDTEEVITPYTDKYTEETLNFTYMNAGYSGHYADCDSEENSQVTASVIEIYSDRLTISRFGTTGLHCLSGEGHFNTFSPYNDLFTVIDSVPPVIYPGIFPTTDSEHLLSERIESPANIARIPAHEHTFEKGICTVCSYKDPDYIDDKPVIRGDVTGDGKVNGSDAIVLKKMIVGKSPTVSEADINYDGKVNSSDIAILKKIIVGKAA